MYSVGTADSTRYLFKSVQGASLAAMRANITNF